MINQKFIQNFKHLKFLMILSLQFHKSNLKFDISKFHHF